MADKKPDPTKDSEFQKVIRHFVTTPHKPHAPIGEKKKEASGKGTAKGKGEKKA